MNTEVCSHCNGVHSERCFHCRGTGEEPRPPQRDAVALEKHYRNIVDEQNRRMRQIEASAFRTWEKAKELEEKYAESCRAYEILQMEYNSLSKKAQLLQIDMQKLEAARKQDYKHFDQVAHPSWKDRYDNLHREFQEFRNRYERIEMELKVKEMANTELRKQHADMKQKLDEQGWQRLVDDLNKAQTLIENLREEVEVWKNNYDLKAAEAASLDKMIQEERKERLMWTQATYTVIKRIESLKSILEPLMHKKNTP